MTLKQFLLDRRVLLTLAGHMVLAAATLAGLVPVQTVVIVLVVFHLGVTLIALWPRSQWLGTNHSRLPPSAAQQAWISLTFDDGPDLTITPKVLDMLDAAHCKASFFCIAQTLNDPAKAAMAREILRRGHSLENHSHSHPISFSFSGFWRLQREIDQAQQTIHATTGAVPLFFRAPAGLRNPLLQPLLDFKRLRLTSWTRRGFDTKTTNPATIVRRLTTGLAAGDILLIHDGNSARDAKGNAVALEVLAQVLAALKDNGLTSVSLRQGFFC
jgi:peptidoglycan-N-acetylglucosamine deacetylase